jgi:cell division protein FtsQ
MKRILNIIFTCLLAAGVVFLFVFANQKQHDVLCESFEINILYNGAPELITKSTIRNQITESGIRVKGQPVISLPVKKLQKLLNKNPYVKKATISVGVNGIVKANILQRNPLVRVVDNEFNQCLLDYDGIVMPVNPDFPVRLVLANGNISSLRLINALSEKKASKTLPRDLGNVHKIALKLQTDTLTSALVEQIYINEKKEIELIPKIGDQSIILGDTILLDEKLKNLRVFYKEGMKNFAWNNYKVINLKYKNQVVCSK